MNRIKRLSSAIAVTAAFQVAGSVAAPGTLSQDPLFVDIAVQPNIFFLMDDSGSMHWEVLQTAEGRIAYGRNNFANPSVPRIDWGVLDYDYDGYMARVEHCRGYNLMAYNPSATYEPWEGEDINGIPFTDQTLSSARNNPYDPAEGVIDLTNVGGMGGVGSAFYGSWNDVNDDGLYQSGECPTNYPDSRWVNVSTLTAEQQINYANWYSYYRKREYVAKRALSVVIKNSSDRLGLATINSVWNDGVEIKDADDISTPINTAAQANKDALFRALFSIETNDGGGPGKIGTRGTPLRVALKRAGDYFRQSESSGTTSLFGFTPTAYNGSDTIDKSPIFTATNGGECQQNFTVLFSDGEWNGSSPSVGNEDGDNDSSFDGGLYADNYSNTLADVAMRYYEIDLAPSLLNKLVESDRDQNKAQHMVTYTVAFGLEPTSPDAAITGAWIEPIWNDITTVDDMNHAAFNGRGEFLSAANPQDLIESFDEAFSDIQDRTSSAASVSFNSTSLDVGSLLFRANFNPAGWFGNLRALSASSSGVGSEVWNVADLLNDSSVTADTRDIITFNGVIGVSFDWPADYTNPNTANGEISANQVVDLLADLPSDVDSNNPIEVAAYGADIVDFLRGDHSKEGVAQRYFRDRKGRRLGDIVHSSPVFVAEPNQRYPEDIGSSGSPYSTFVANNLNRQEVVYVGANDGMLHAFSAGGSSAGQELFAYIPGFLFSARSGEGLHALADDNYVHRSYVDSTATAGDVFIDGSWKTYLVGGARAGGKGVYVLDITNPANFDESNADSLVVMEFTDVDLGFTYSEISIAKMNNGKWAAIFGNGYNNTGDGTAKVYVVYLDGSGFTTLETGVGSIANSDCGDAGSDCNGMASPEVLDLNSDGVADRIYAGDLKGNMWAFDVSPSSSASWGSAYSGALFTATSSGGSVQPITTKPSVVAHPNRISETTSPNLIVTFGTGQYLTNIDVTSTSQQTFYGVWDAGVGGLNRDDLVFQTLTETTAGSPSVTVREVTDNPVDYVVGSKMGWGIDLPGSGERSVVNPAVVGGIAFFNTLKPDTASCGGAGSGFFMNVDLINGGKPDFQVINVDNSGIYAGVESEGVATASTFVGSGDSSGSDGSRFVNTSKGVKSENLYFDSKPASRTSWTNLLR